MYSILDNLQFRDLRCLFLFITVYWVLCMLIKGVPVCTCRLVYVRIYACMYTYIFPFYVIIPIYLYVIIPIYLSVCLFIYLSIHPSTFHPSTHLFCVCIYIYIYVYIYIYICIHKCVPTCYNRLCITKPHYNTKPHLDAVKS